MCDHPVPCGSWSCARGVAATSRPMRTCRLTLGDETLRPACCQAPPAGFFKERLSIDITTWCPLPDTPPLRAAGAARSRDDIPAAAERGAFGRAPSRARLVPTSQVLTALPACSTWSLVGLLRPTADPEVHRVSTTAALAARASPPLRCHALQSFPHPHSRARVTARPCPLAVAACVPTCGGDATSGPCSMRVSVVRGRRCQRLGPVALLGFPSLEPHARCLSCPPPAMAPSPGDDHLDVRPARVRRALEGPARPRRGLDPDVARPALPRGGGRSPSAGTRRSSAPTPYLLHAAPAGDRRPLRPPHVDREVAVGFARQRLVSEANRERHAMITPRDVVRRVSGGLPQGEPATRRVGPTNLRRRAAKPHEPSWRLPPPLVHPFGSHAAG